MIKTLAIAAALTLGAGSAMAAEVGVRHSTGSSHRTYTHGQMDYSYQGGSQFGSQTRSQASDVRVRGNGNRVRTATSGTYSWERGGSSYNGSESARFSGGEYNTFSETSTFAR